MKDNINKISEYIELAHKMNKQIHIINVDFNSDTVTKNGEEALAELENIHRDYVKLCKEIKNNPYLYKESDINTVNRDMSAYKNMILNAKKIMIYFYNLKIYELNRRINIIKVNGGSREDFEEKSLLDSIKVPEYSDKFISNYQDKVVLDFDNLNKISDTLSKIESSLLVAREFDKLVKMDYIENYIFDRIENNINNYGTDKNITKTSIENDIFWVAYELDSLKKTDLDDYYPSRITYIESKLEFLKDKLSKKRAVKDGHIENEEYYLLKEKLDIFIREVSEYRIRLQNNSDVLSEEKIANIKNKLMNLYAMYDKLSDKTKNDKVLNNNLIALYDKLKEEVKEFIKENKDKTDEIAASVEEPKKEEIKALPAGKEHEEIPKKEEPTPDSGASTKVADLDEGYKVDSVRDGDIIYKKKLKKNILISASLATVALLIPSLTSLVLPAILVQNAYLLASEPVTNKINNIIGKSIGAKKNKDGKWYNSYGEPITKKSTLSGLLKSLVVNGVGKPNFVSIIADRIKNVDKAEPHYSYKNGMLPKQENNIERLYEYFNKSGKRFADFCESEHLNNEVTSELANYIINSSVAATGGRTR